MSPRKIISSLLLVCIATFTAQGAEEPTAFELVKEGNRYVGEQAKDRVVQIRSEKSVGSLSPKIWWVVYYDPTATFKSVEVKFSAGKMVDVKRPFRLLETVSSSTKSMDKEKMKVDSDKAIQIALKEPILENITPKAVSAKLEESDTGPVWKVRIWAAKFRNPNDQADLGEITLTADDGTVINNDLHINRVD